MKKLFFYAAAAVGMLSACSSSDDFASYDGLKDESREAIKIGVTSVAASVQTRGTGTVGGVSDGETVITPNNWDGQNVNVFMFNKGTLDLACSDINDPTTALYENAVMTTPVGAATGEANLADNEYKYYPPAGAFDFYGYRVDDAADAANAALNAEGTAYTIDFTIDGTQDVMRAETELSADDQAKIADNTNTVTEADIYSAKAARQKIQPNLLFNHLLSRFTFQVKGGNENSCPKESDTEDNTTAVKVKSIKLTSRTNGTLTIAHLPENAPADGQYIAWAEDEAESEGVTGVTTDEGKFLPFLTLKSRTATKEVEVEAAEATEEDGTTVKEGYRKDDATGKYYKTVDDANSAITETATVIPNMWVDGASAAKNVGEALLVSPGLDKYTLEVSVEQKVLSHEAATPTDGDYRVKTNVYTLDITPDMVVKDGANGVAAFEAGKSYNVIITVYGFERIEVSTTLQPWENGGDIEVGQD